MHLDQDIDQPSQLEVKKDPNSIVGDNRLWKNTQKNEIKKSTSVP
jgi:hypothetical protein